MNSAGFTNGSNIYTHLTCSCSGSAYLIIRRLIIGWDDLLWLLGSLLWWLLILRRFVRWGQHNSLCALGILVILWFDFNVNSDLLRLWFLIFAFCMLASSLKMSPTVLFTDLGNTTATCILDGETLTFAIMIMKITLFVLTIFFLHANALGFGASSSTKVLLMNVFILNKCWKYSLCILFLHLHSSLVAEQFDGFGDRLDR